MKKSNIKIDVNEMLILGNCPSQYGLDEEDCYHDTCRECWEKVIKREKAIDTLNHNKLYCNS